MATTTDLYGHLIDQALWSAAALRRNWNRVSTQESSYRNQMVKHEPEPHTLCTEVLLYFAAVLAAQRLPSSH